MYLYFTFSRLFVKQGFIMKNRLFGVERIKQAWKSRPIAWSIAIRDDDRGLLWEHVALDVLRTRFYSSNIYYWRDKSNREIDFIIKAPREKVHTIERKINPDQFDPKTLRVFRSLYPEGDDFFISPRIKQSCKRRYDDLIVNLCSLNDLLNG